MSDFVELYLKRNRGWPWPEESWGLTPMFGEDGWCRSCGVPKRRQCGSLILGRKGFKVVEGAWVPNWQFDAICMEQRLAEKVAGQFAVKFMPVRWRGGELGPAEQIIAESPSDAWFDEAALRNAAMARHGTAGARCDDCGVWRWMPLSLGDLPAPRIDAALVESDVIASPEWFGDGWNAYRQLLARRGLAETLVAASPRDFKVNEVAPI